MSGSSARQASVRATPSAVCTRVWTRTLGGDASQRRIAVAEKAGLSVSIAGEHFELVALEPTDRKQWIVRPRVNLARVLLRCEDAGGFIDLHAPLLKFSA
jgi:hypothetical protein